MLVFFEGLYTFRKWMCYVEKIVYPRICTPACDPFVPLGLLVYLYS
jgi:hypothetical protein